MYKMLNGFINAFVREITFHPSILLPKNLMLNHLSDNLFFNLLKLFFYAVS